MKFNAGLLHHGQELNKLFCNQNFHD